MLSEILHAGLWQYAIVAFLLVVTPGADVALVTGSALRRGMRGALLTTSGICTGAGLWAVASAVGLIAILTSSRQLYDAITFLGAFYMFYIGYLEIRAARRVPDAPAESATQPADPGAGSDWGFFAKGFVTNILNPKVGIFYAAFLPQFVRTTDYIFVEILLLGLIHIVLGFTWLTVYAAFLRSLRGVLERPPVKRVLLYATGGVIVLFGVLVVWNRFA